MKMQGYDTQIKRARLETICKENLSDVVFGALNSRLGDLWCLTGLLFDIHMQTGEILRVSSRTSAQRIIARKLQELFFAVPMQRWTEDGQAVRAIEFTQLPANRYFSLSDGYAGPSPPVHATAMWHAADRLPYVVTQFKGAKHWAKKKCWPESWYREIQGAIRKLGWTPVEIGDVRITVFEATRLMSHARMFIGIDSGWSHVAHSVGVPVTLLENKLPVLPQHMGKPMRVCRTMCGVRRALEAVR